MTETGEAAGRLCVVRLMRVVRLRSLGEGHGRRSAARGGEGRRPPLGHRPPETPPWSLSVAVREDCRLRSSQEQALQILSVSIRLFQLLCSAHQISRIFRRPRSLCVKLYFSLEMFAAESPQKLVILTCLITCDDSLLPWDYRLRDAEERLFGS